MLIHHNVHCQTLADPIKQQGMTLVELMVGIAILGIISAIAVPSYTEFIANTQIRSTTESIRNGLQVARAEAIKRNAPVKFTLNTSDTSWVVGCITTTTTCPATIQSKTPKEGGSSSITVAVTGANPITFNNLGSISALSQIDVDNNSIAAAKSKDLRIRVGVGGNVRVCDPNVTLTTDTRHCAT